jgi:hypothetical protein
MRTQKTYLVALAVVVLALVTASPASAERPIDAVRAQNPDAFHVVAGPVELAVPAGSPEPFVETVVDSRVDDRAVTAGTRLFAGALLAEGALINRGEGTLTVRHPDGGQTAVAPGQGLVVSEATAIAADACATCSVSCGAGFFACCKRETLFNCAKCTCVANGTAATCSSGGPGATSCSVGAATAADGPEVLEPDFSFN